MKASVMCLLLCTAALSQAAEFDHKAIELTHPANGDMLHLAQRKQLLVSGYSQFERWLSQVDLTTYNSRALPIPEDAQFFSQATLAGEPASQLVFLGLGGISRLTADASKSELVVASDSLYRVLDKNRLREADFVVDLGSGLSDFLIADFTHTHLYRQQADGQFLHFALEIPAIMQSWNTSPTYEARKHYIVDVENDGLADLVFVQGGHFLAFRQQADGSFMQTPKVLSWPIVLSTEQQADQRNDAGLSYAGQNIDKLREITDIDGDGILDIVIDREQFADALERNNSFNIYFGHYTKQGLMFNPSPDTQITTESSPIAVEIADLNNDGRKDFYIPSTHFGVSTIIRVLLRGSANLDVDFYLLNAKRQYPQKADFQQQAKIEVSISNFRFDMPLLQLADLTGKGNKSLLIGDGDDELKVYKPDDKRLFSKRAKSWQLTLPRDARKVRIFDLNADGKEDLVLPFDAQSPQLLRNQMHFILFR